MRRFNAGVITLLIIAAYFIATAFIPDLYLAFNYKLILALLFVLLSWQSKGKFLFFLGMAFLSTYIHDLFRLDYLRQAQFMTDRPQIVVQANFSHVVIRVPKDWQVDTHGLHTSLAGVKGYDSLGERDLSSTTVSLTGSVSFGQVTVKH